MKLTLENVRGFAGRHELDIKPVTLVVGENSSGKTTLLASLAAVLQTDFPSAEVLNRAPFELGSFDTIATYRGGKYGRAESFSLGWQMEGRGQHAFSARFIGHQGVPRLDGLEIQSAAESLKGSPTSGEWSATFPVEGKPFPATLSFKNDPSELRQRQFTLAEIPHLFAMAARHKDFDRENLQNDKGGVARAMDVFLRLTTTLNRFRPRVTSLAPLRTRPHRTYDQLIEEFKPEGDHVPLVLARLLSGGLPNDDALADSVHAFGEASGLFSKLKVKRMGRHGDPFQLRVKSLGPDANLVDVGYGVSQALPIVVDSIIAPKNRIILVQQPEVHLHPRAQAALGTFFSELAKDGSKRFVIETHSDYLVDRVRMAVADGLIGAPNVNIAFLERKGLDVSIHQLSLDEKGNIVNAPACYRSFFLEEETRLLFRGEL